MSKSLRRLREIFDDPLFTRSLNGALVPTPLAESLVAPLSDAFAQLEYVLARATFDPAKAHGTIRIAAPETFALGGLPRLILRLRQIAPSLHIEAYELMDNYLELLASGALDFVIHVNNVQPERYITTQLLSAEAIFWARKNHPLSKRKKASLKDIFKNPLIAFHSLNVPPKVYYKLRQALSDEGIALDILLETTQLMVALQLVRESDALLLAPDYLSGVPGFEPDMVLECSIGHIPIFNKLRIGLYLVQHERTSNSSLHQWIADVMAEEYSRAA